MREFPELERGGHADSEILGGLELFGELAQRRRGHANADANAANEEESDEGEPGTHGVIS